MFYFLWIFFYPFSSIHLLDIFLLSQHRKQMSSKLAVIFFIYYLSFECSFFLRIFLQFIWFICSSKKLYLKKASTSHISKLSFFLSFVNGFLFFLRFGKILDMHLNPNAENILDPWNKSGVKFTETCCCNVHFRLGSYNRCSASTKHSHCRTFITLIFQTC